MVIKSKLGEQWFGLAGEWQWPLVKNTNGGEETKVGESQNRRFPLVPIF